MTATEIIDIAREKLPFTSEVWQNEWQVPVENIHAFELQLAYPLKAPSKIFTSCYLVTFRKKKIMRVVVGWEFVDLSSLV